MTASASIQNNLTTTGSALLSCWTDAAVVSTRRGGILMNSFVLLAVSLFVPALPQMVWVMVSASLSAHVVAVVATMRFSYSLTNKQRFLLDAHWAHCTVVGVRSRVQESPCRIHRLHRCVFIECCDEAQLIRPCLVIRRGFDFSLHN